MTIDKDEWGHDPSVQKTRVVFSIMEKAQNVLIKHAGLSFFDSRLREVREIAQKLFYRGFEATATKEMNADEAVITGLYMDALIRAFRRAGVSLPENFNIDGPTLEGLIREVLS